MKEYAIYYIGIEDGKEMKCVGSGYGKNEDEAIKDFMFWHNDCKRIVEVKFYKQTTIPIEGDYK